jgi:hypothetical protein
MRHKTPEVPRFQNMLSIVCQRTNNPYSRLEFFFQPASVEIYKSSYLLIFGDIKIKISVSIRENMLSPSKAYLGLVLMRSFIRLFNCSKHKNSFVEKIELYKNELFDSIAMMADFGIHVQKFILFHAFAEKYSMF